MLRLKLSARQARENHGNAVAANVGIHGRELTRYEPSSRHHAPRSTECGEQHGGFLKVRGIETFVEPAEYLSQMRLRLVRTVLRA